MLLKFVPAAVLNNGTEVRAEQVWNMVAKFVPAAVLNNGTEARAGQ